MSELIEIVVGVAVVAYAIGRQVIGEPLRGKRVVILPIVLTIIGIADLSGDKTRVRAVDVAFLILGAVVVAAIGLALGKITRLESRNGSLWGQLPVKGLWLWALLIGSRVLIMAIADGSGAKVAASTSSILLMLGINRLAQAAIILPRAMATGTPFAPEKDGRQRFTTLTALTTVAPGSDAAPAPLSAPIDLRRISAPPDVRANPRATPSPAPARPAGIDWSALGRQAATALADHHRNHEERHDHHDRRRDGQDGRDR